MTPDQQKAWEELVESVAIPYNNGILYLTEDAHTILAADAELKRLREGHCDDCCCARSWDALGIIQMDGKSIPEHIATLRARIEDVEGIRVMIKHERFDTIQDPFIEYQAGRMSKGKLCEYIARAVSRWLKEGKG
jgi:hypothetical protein